MREARHFLVSRSLSLCSERAKSFLMPLQFKSLLLISSASVSTKSLTPRCRQKGNTVWGVLCVEIVPTAPVYITPVGFGCCYTQVQGRWRGCKIDPGRDIPLAATSSEGNEASLLMGSCLSLPKETPGLLPASGTAVCVLL